MTDTMHTKEKLRWPSHNHIQSMLVVFFLLFTSVVLFMPLGSDCVRAFGKKGKKENFEDFYFKIIIRFHTNSCFSDFFEILRLKKVVVCFYCFLGAKKKQITRRKIFFIAEVWSKLLVDFFLLKVSLSLKDGKYVLKDLQKSVAKGLKDILISRK